MTYHNPGMFVSRDDDPQCRAFDNLIGSEEFGRKFLDEHAQEFIELLDRIDGPAGDKSIVDSVRRLERKFHAMAEVQIAENEACRLEFDREVREGR